MEAGGCCCCGEIGLRGAQNRAAGLDNDKDRNSFTIIVIIIILAVTTERCAPLSLPAALGRVG